MAKQTSDSRQPARPVPPGSTAILLARAREGDAGARAELMNRYLPALYRIAHGRLPARARGQADTNDLVQTTLLKALNRLDRFEHRGEGAFLAYLRQILANQIRDEARRASSMGEREELTDEIAQRDVTPLQQVIDRETLEAYDAAIAKLRSRQRQAVILRIEFGFDHAQVAEALGYSTPNAARLVVSRALLRLVSHLRNLRDGR